MWRFRRDLHTPRQALTRGVLPLVGAVILTLCFLKSAHDMYASDYGKTSFDGVGGVFLLGVGALVLGVLVMIACELAMPAFFRPRAATTATLSAPVAPTAPRQAASPPATSDEYSRES